MDLAIVLDWVTGTAGLFSAAFQAWIHGYGQQGEAAGGSARLEPATPSGCTAIVSLPVGARTQADQRRDQ